MDEIQLLRAQLALERRHACAAAHACAASLRGGDAPQLREACGAYLGCVLRWFQERDERALTFTQERPELAAVVAAGGSSGEALAKLGAAGADAGSWGELAQFLAGAWRERGELMEEVLRAHARPSDWRRIIALSADSIMQEREQFERVCTILAPGLAPEAIAL